MRRRWVLGLGGAALVACGLVWALSAKDGTLELSERTDVLGMVCAVVGVVGLVATFWRQSGADEDVAAAVARLADEVRDVGEPQWLHSLGGHFTAIDVTFTFRPYTGARTAVLPSAPARQLVQVIEDFRAIKPGRLVITGEPGAGKTVLARKLTIELNRVRTEQEPVPVLIPLADWDEDEPLVRWIARHLERDYGLSRASAHKVVKARMVLPVLDGLDEMDAVDAPADRVRAKTALQALDRYQDGTDAAPLVLTCRTSEYDAFEAEGLHILDSARIEIDPVTPAQARHFLSQRGAARRPARWQGVLDEFRAEPGGVLARALSTPWRLTLATTVYEQSGDPAELLGAATTGEVADRLLSRYIAAATSSSPKGPGRYRSEQVHRWLAVLARSMGAGSGAETDLALLEMGRRIRRWRVEMVRWGMWAVLIAMGGIAASAAAPSDSTADISVVLVICVSLVLSVTTGVMDIPPLRTGIPAVGDPLWRVGFRLLARRPGREDLIMLLLMVALPVYVLSRPQSVPQAEPWPVFVMLGIAAAAWCVLEAGTLVDTAACGPAGVLRGGVAFAVLVLAFLGLLAVSVGVSFTSITGFSLLMVLLVAKLPGHVEFLAFALWNSRRLPLRLVRFLDWSVTAGLMRTSGVAYQFRHREFQEWLVRHPEPVAQP